MYLKNSFHEIFRQIGNDATVWKLRNFTLPGLSGFFDSLAQNFVKEKYRKFWFHEIFIWTAEERVSRFPFPTLWFGTESFFWSISYLQKVYKTPIAVIFSPNQWLTIFSLSFSSSSKKQFSHFYCFRVAQKLSITRLTTGDFQIKAKNFQKMPQFLWDHEFL